MTRQMPYEPLPASVLYGLVCPMCMTSAAGWRWHLHLGSDQGTVEQGWSWLAKSTYRRNQNRAFSWWRLRKGDLHAVALAFHQNVIKPLASVGARPSQNVPGQPWLRVQPIAWCAVVRTDRDASNKPCALTHLYLAAKAQLSSRCVRQTENQLVMIVVANRHGKRKTLGCAVSQLFALRNWYAVNQVIRPQREQPNDSQHCRNTRNHLDDA